MANSERSPRKSTKKAAPKPAPVEEPQETASEPIEPDAQQEATARQAVAQQLVDDGYAIVGAGQDEDGRHWIDGQRDGDDEVKRAYVEGEQA